jgi:ribosomal protein S18 acetylase RimI-like enzyme
MNPTITIVSPLGPVLLRPEREEDQPFRYELFCNSRLPEWYQVELDPAVREQLMQHQFNAQTVSYRAQFPNARFDIIWLDGRPIGRIIVDGPHRFLHIVDQAIVPELRSRGIGSAIMRYFMDRAAAAAARSMKYRMSCRSLPPTIRRCSSICASGSCRWRRTRCTSTCAGSRPACPTTGPPEAPVSDTTTRW